MSRLCSVGSRRVVGPIVLAAVVALSIVGCSGTDGTTPKASSGSSSSSDSPVASPGGLKDESAAVLGWAPPAPVARTKGNLERITTRALVPSTAEIIAVVASDASTVLTWQLSSSTDIPLLGQSLQTTEFSGFWPGAVRLVEPTAKKSYAVNTMKDSLGSYCVCSRYPTHVGPDPVRMTAEYPALPASATTVSVRIPNFAPVSVPVTR